jgi:hypothetical protein
MSNGATFWWMPDRAQLGEDGFTTELFSYAEIVSITVFERLRLGGEELCCDWDSLRRQLQQIKDLQIKELKDVRCPPAVPPNQALFLTAAT